MSRFMWTTLCLVNLLQSHTSQKRSMMPWAGSTWTAKLWLENVLRNHTSKGRAVRPCTGSGNGRRGVVMSGQTPNVLARPWFRHCGILIKANGLRLTNWCRYCATHNPQAMSRKCWQRTRADFCARAEKLLRADGWCTNTVLVRRSRGNASCNVPVQNEWPLSDDNCGKRKTLLKTLYGAIRSRWPTDNLELQEYCSLPQQKFIDPTNAVYAFTFPHVGPTARLPTQDVILSDLLESVLGFWWVLDVSDMMAVQKYSELMGSFLSNLEFAITSVSYWRSQDGPWFQKTYDSTILSDARSYASDAAALNNSKPGAPAPPPPSQAASVRQANCSDAVNDLLSAASWNTSEPNTARAHEDLSDTPKFERAYSTLCLLCLASMLRCPRCHLDQLKGKGTNVNWSDSQWRQ